MADVALLNPAEDAPGAKALLNVAKDHLTGLEASLTTSVLDRELYLQNIGAATKLRLVIKDMEREYGRRFRV